MICYRDMTFCISKHCTCERKLTPAIIAAAERWWVQGGGKKEDTPIATAEFCKPTEKQTTRTDHCPKCGYSEYYPSYHPQTPDTP